MKTNIIKNQGFVIQGVIAIVALVIIAGGAYYAGTHNGDVELIPYDEDVPILYNNEEISTPDWKTYTNKKEGYEFKYPSTWKIDQNLDGLDTSIALYPTNSSTNDGSVGISIVNTELKMDNNVSLTGPDQLIMINGTKWVKLEEDGYVEYLSGRNEKTYIVGGRISLVNQMINTFTFTK